MQTEWARSSSTEGSSPTRRAVLLAVIAVGVLWAILATGVHLSMFGGLLPPPGELPLPLAIALVFADLPLLGALFLETAAGRASPTLNEVITVAIFAGIVLAFAIATLILGVRRPIR
jgi:hypothetical protein